MTARITFGTKVGVPGGTKGASGIRKGPGGPRDHRRPTSAMVRDPTEREQTGGMDVVGVESAEFADRLVSLRETRARLPELVRNRHAGRRRRSVAGHSGRLLLIEADAPARALLAAGADMTALADRDRLLHLLSGALAIEGVDGVIGSVDIIDDLLLLDALDDRIAIGSMNPGGVTGSPVGDSNSFTGYDAESVAASHLDGGKVRVRIDPDDPSTSQVLETAGHLVTALASEGLLALLEPSWWARGSGGRIEDRSAEALVRAMDVSAALGGRSPYTWLAMPDAEELGDALAGTTLPVLVRVDGEPVDAGAAKEVWGSLLRLPGVRGLVLPAAQLYPRSGEPWAAVVTAARLMQDLMAEDWQ